MSINKVRITGVNTSSLPVLCAKESEEILRRIKKGEENLRDLFIEGNMRLVLSLVQRFNTDKVSPDDMFQLGVLGLIKALDNFNVDLNVRFSTYAVPLIIGEIRRYIRESTALKVGRGVRDIAYRAMQARTKLEKEKTNVDLAEIAAEIQVPYVEVIGALDAISEPLSLYEKSYNDEESIMVVDKIKDPEGEEELIDRLTLDGEIKKLPEKEQKIIDLRYYQGKTQTEISQELQISQAQISRLEKSAIGKLRTAFLV